MKRIEYMEGLGPEILDRIASDSGITVPENLEARIVRNARTLEVLSGTCNAAPAAKDIGWRISVFSYAAAAVALAAVLITVRPGIPEDTFEDPYTAFAEFERTINYIQDKTDAGLEFAGSKVEPVIEKTLNILK